METLLTFEKIGLGKPRPFTPLAYFDKHMDCIRIELRDCSITEIRINEVVTILEDNHPRSHQSRWCGLMIKGVKHLFKSLDLPLDGVIKVTRILDELVKRYPDAINAEIQKLVYAVELSVDLNETPSIAA